MAEVRIRIDSRLIHGQVIARWASTWSLKRIIIVDEPLSQDDFMKDIYLMAAPPDVPVAIFTPEEALADYENGDKQNGNTLILLKDVAHAEKLRNAGFPIESIQIGGLPSGPGRKLVYKTISLNDEDRGILNTLTESGIKIFFQMLPEEEPCIYESGKY